MYVCSSIYLHPRSPNTACNCLLHMNLSIAQLLCLYMLCMSISLCRYRVLIFFLYFLSSYIYIHTHLYLFIYINVYYIYTYIYICFFKYTRLYFLFSLSFSHVSSARAPPQFFSPLFQFYFTLPQFHFIAAKKAPETCACFPLPCMFPSSAHLFPHSCDL